mgnify:CR=1 FL=1
MSENDSHEPVTVTDKRRIDPQTGKLAAPGGAVIDEVFLLGTEPKEQALAPGDADPDKAIQDNN